MPLYGDDVVDYCHVVGIGCAWNS